MPDEIKPTPVTITFEDISDILFINSCLSYVIDNFDNYVKPLEKKAWWNKYKAMDTKIKIKYLHGKISLIAVRYISQ